MKRFFIAGLLAFSLFSCAAVSEFFDGEDMVVTTAENVSEGADFATIPTGSLPDEVTAVLPEGTTFVLTERDNLASEESPFVQVVGTWDDRAKDTAIEIAFDAAMLVGKTFIPGLAAWEALLAIFFRRKRKHYANALKAVLPMDKTVDLGGALGSLASALGMTHSSAATEDVFEEEEAEEA